MKRKKLQIAKSLLVSMRPLQWIKNLAVFASIIFSGYLFEFFAFWRAFLGFLSFCLVSSASYIFNDLVDAPLDRKHPFKRERPIAKGIISFQLAAFAVIFLFFLGFGIAAWVNFAFLMIILIFFILHIFYTLVFKKRALWDILAIASSFILRAFGGELATGYHLPVWLTFTVVFLSLFIASGKRRGEAVLEGEMTRPALKYYRIRLIDFYLSVFAVATLVAYSLFTYFAGPQTFAQHYLQEIFGFQYYLLIDRKWLMVSIFPVIFGIMKYAQIVFYHHAEGERPEKALTSHPSLLLTVLIWGLVIIIIIYG